MNPFYCKFLLQVNIAKNPRSSFLNKRKCTTEQRKWIITEYATTRSPATGWSTFVESTFIEGTLVEQNIGRTEHWSNGTLLVKRNIIGRMEHWSNRTLVERNIRLTEHSSNLK